MDTGVKVYRNYFKIPFGWQAACKYGAAYPCFRKFVLPGDVFKIHADLLIRYQPMMAPPMNNTSATVRFAFVPLRQIEENTELILTGSKQGKLYTETLPVFDSVFKNLEITSSHGTVEKNSVLDFLYNIPAGLDLSTSGLLAKLEADKASPAAYFAKAYYKFWYDFYRDENLSSISDDFETFWQQKRKQLHVADTSLMNVYLKKDRITSSLPWQLKAVSAPTIEITGSGTLTPNFNSDWVHLEAPMANYEDIYASTQGYQSENGGPFQLSSDASATDIANFNAAMNGTLNQVQSGGVSISAGALNAAKFRDMMAQTRVFERLARCGSRFTEFLYANFGIAPNDETLQRAKYLGGFKTHIVTTEVVQTAGDDDYPVGTLRGHGITHGTSTIKPFLVKEPGIVIGILDVKPETIYAQGVDRELTYRSRFDFFNPSFQHLSEQEVRKGEVYFDVDMNSSSLPINSETWGFQPYGQELRTGIKHVCGEMRDSLSFWNQALILSSRPSLNSSFASAGNHRASYNRPFVVQDVSNYPMVVDFGGVIEAYRPLVKNGTPGLVDHN